MVESSVYITVKVRPSNFMISLNGVSIEVKSASSFVK